jgi:hypothetical protein
MGSTVSYGPRQGTEALHTCVVRQVGVEFQSSSVTSLRLDQQFFGMNFTKVREGFYAG